MIFFWEIIILLGINLKTKYIGTCQIVECAYSINKLLENLDEKNNN